MKAEMDGGMSQCTMPELVHNSQDGVNYRAGKFLGKGGFAKCYELKRLGTSEVYAAKVISKLLVLRTEQRNKVKKEVEIHRMLDHHRIVRLHEYFEDDDNIYIILELCTRRSLMELHKRRKIVTEIEARYFIKQVAEGCAYLHSQRVIHRDLKLGNVFLNEEMNVKIGDFGLATVLDHDGERKQTLCGTPNYIAPEVLCKKGHSYEVDIWAIGCITFTLLVGKPPFETKSLKQTYLKIQNNDYEIPSTVSAEAAELIRALLEDNPYKRPTVKEVVHLPILSFKFFDAHTPNRLPSSCLDITPIFVASNVADARQPLGEIQKKTQNAVDSQPPVREVLSSPSKSKTVTLPLEIDGKNDSEFNSSKVNPFLSKLHSQITAIVQSSKPIDSSFDEDLLEDPRCTPIYWISKWVDYSDQYGLAYLLCDNSAGVLYNDGTTLMLHARGSQLQYRKRGGDEQYYTLAKYPEWLDKKVTLLSYFRNFMNEHLLPASGTVLESDESDALERLPVLIDWLRTRSSMTLFLSNGTLQINFTDHVKLVICPVMDAITYFDSNRKMHVFKTKTLIVNGCPTDIHERLSYSVKIMDRLIMRQAYRTKSA